MRNAEKMSPSKGTLDTMRRILKKEGEESIENQCEQKGSEISINPPFRYLGPNLTPWKVARGESVVLFLPP